MDRPSESLTRRTLLRRGGAAGGLLLLPGLLGACGGEEEGASTSGSGAAAGESAELTRLLDGITSTTLIFGGYGGATAEARKKAFFDPFTERTGVKVVSVDNTGTKGDDMALGKIPATWDAYHGSTYQILQSKLEGKKPLGESRADEDLVPAEARPYAFQSFFIGYVPGYIKSHYADGAAPATWADFFDFKKFPGKRAWPNQYYIDAVLEAALMADGVAPDAVYPLDIERATAKIQGALDNFVIYEAYPQISVFLTSKTAAMAFTPNGVLKALDKKGVETTAAYEQVITSCNCAEIMPDAPNEDAAVAFSAFCAQPERVAQFCTETSYGPAIEEAFDLIDPAVLEEMPNAPGRNPIAIDDQYYAENYADMGAAVSRIFS